MVACIHVALSPSDMPMLIVCSPLLPDRSQKEIQWSVSSQSSVAATGGSSPRSAPHPTPHRDAKDWIHDTLRAE